MTTSPSSSWNGVINAGMLSADSSVRRAFVNGIMQVVIVAFLSIIILNLYAVTINLLFL